MAWRHRPAFTVIDKLHQQAWVLRADALCRTARIGPKQRLHIAPQRLGHDRSMLAGKVLALVHQFAAVAAVGTHVGQRAPPERPPRPVAVAKVLEKDVPLYIDEIGTCAANESVQVKAQIAGQIVSRDFKDGAEIKRGEILFTVDQRPYQAALDSAKADDMLAQATLKRQEDLKAKGVTATQDLDTAKANAMKRSAAVAAAQVIFDYCTFRSPIDGRAGLR